MLDDIMTGSSAVRQSKTILAPCHSHPNGTAFEMRSKPRPRSKQPHETGYHCSGHGDSLQQ